MLFNCSVEEDSWESLGWQDQSVNSKGNQCWIFIGRTDAETEAPILWSPDLRTDSLEKTLMLGKIEGRRRGDNTGWVGWMASPTRWTWIWASSGSWWWTGRSGVLQSMGSQRVKHDWATDKLNWAESQWSLVAILWSRKGSIRTTDSDPCLQSWKTE